MRVSQVAAGSCIAGLALAAGLAQGFRTTSGPVDAIFSPFSHSYAGLPYKPLHKGRYYEKALPKTPSARQPTQSTVTDPSQRLKSVNNEAPPVPPKDYPTAAGTHSEPDSDTWTLLGDTAVGDNESARSLAVTDTDTWSLSGDAIRSQDEDKDSNMPASETTESASKSSKWSSHFNTLKNKLSLSNLKGTATNVLEYLGLPGTKKGLWALAFGDRAGTPSRPAPPTAQSTAPQAPTAHTKYNIDYIYVFGDSLSDTGNLFKELQGIYPPPEYYTDHQGTVGRFTNGKAWPDHLQDMLHPNVQVKSYAHGGATTGMNGGSSHVMIDGQYYQSVDVNTQVTEFLAQFDRQQGPRTAAILWAGSNDIMHKSKSGKGRDPRMLGQTLKQTLVHLETQIKRLDEAGIRHIIVFNLPNISQTPALSQRLAAKKQQIRNNFTRKTSQPTAWESDSDYDIDVEDTLTASFDDDDNDDEVMWPKEVASNSPNFQTLGRTHFRLHSHPSGRSGAQSPIPETVPLLHPEILTESDEAYDTDDEAETKPKKSLKSRTKKLFTKAKPKLEKSVAKVQSMFTDSVNKVAAGATGLFVNAAFQGIKWVVERGINTFNDRLIDTVNSYNQQYPRDTPISVFDVNALFNRLRRTDMNTSTACLHMDEMGNPTGVCEDPNNTLFFDQVHITTRVHEMLASDVKDAMAQSHVL